MLKKHLVLSTFILLFTLFSASLSAQVAAGDRNIGVNGFLTSTSQGGVSTNTMTLLVSSQKYVTDNLSIGSGPQLTLSGSTGNTTTMLALNTFVNYNVLLPDGKVLPYAGANALIQYSITNSDFGGITSEVTSSYINIGLNAGFKYFLTERINFDTNLSYTTIISALTTVDGVSTDGPTDGGTLQLLFGFGFILPQRGN